jgi:very-short-patch-repair endonuclease
MQRRLHGGGAMRATRKSMRNAKRQRRNMSPPEVRLWALLRRSPGGVGFRRQHPIGPYVADFDCPAAKLVIEVDGQIHGHSVDRDAARDDYIRGLGLRVLRIPASDVMADAMSVADGLVRLCGPSTTQLR